MHLKHLLCLFMYMLFIPFVIVQDESSEIQNICYNSSLEDYRLDTSVVKTKIVSERIDCVMGCATESCCRSINFKKIFTSDNESNCEMLHNLVYNTSEKVLEINSSYDHVYLVNPQKEYNASCFMDSSDANISEHDCAAIYEKGVHESGIYEIDPNGGGGFNVSCDMATSGGGWTVFQRRLDGSVDFYREWQYYKHGFGNLTGEYWLGLDKIYRLINASQNELRIDMEDTSGNTAYAHYDSFSVGSEQEKYKLKIGNFDGTAGDSLKVHIGMAFSTKDSDNDLLEGNCAVRYKGAWWYRACHQSNLNGLYHYGAHTSYADGINWKTWKGYQYSLKSTSMKIRPSGHWK